MNEFDINSTIECFLIQFLFIYLFIGGGGIFAMRAWLSHSDRIDCFKLDGNKRKSMV